MNSALSFARIVARCHSEDLDRIVAGDEFPGIAAWLDRHRDAHEVAAALDRLLAAARAQAH